MAKAVYNFSMVKKVFACLVLLLLTSPGASYAIYDPLSLPNNRFGIHILEAFELEKAAQLVNSSGGDWGYVTIPIRANDRSLSKWTNFMNETKKLHLIPIVRISSFAVGDHWMAPNEYDLVDFANFLDELPWPVQNRYVVIYNEPNHKNEWGGFVYPEEYARVLDRAIEIFHQRNKDFFVISAGFDTSAPNSTDSLNEFDYLRIMNARFPGIFNRVDGFSSHAYGNPGFSTAPSVFSRVNIANYRYEENFLSSLGASRPKIFITEAGWAGFAQDYYSQAFTEFWTDDNIVAITPFLLQASAGPFSDFSFLDQNGNFKSFVKDVQQLPKIAGQPKVNSESRNEKEESRNESSNKMTKPNSNQFNFLSTFYTLISKFHP